MLEIITFIDRVKLIQPLYFLNKQLKIHQKMKKQLIGFCLALFMFSLNVLAQKTEIEQQLPLSQNLQSQLYRYHAIETESTPKTNNHKELPTAKNEFSTLKIDSIILRDKNFRSLKEEYIFNSHGIRISMLSSYWNYNKWMNSEKQESAYDSNNNRFSTVLYKWIANTWEYSEKYEYTYDSDNHIILDITSVWDKISNTWIVKYRFEYNYNNDGNEISRMFYRWADNTKDLTLSSKTEFIYNNQGFKSARIVYSWNKNSNLWERVGKNEYTYDSRGNQTSDILYLGARDDTSVGVTKNEYIYDNQNNNTVKIQYFWNSEAQKWLEVYKYEFVYDSNNLFTTQNDYNWDESVKLWIANQEIQYVFDANSNRTSKIIRFRDALTNTWNNNSKTDYTYDNNYKIENLYSTSLIYSSLFETVKNNIPVEATQYIWDNQNQQWETQYYITEKRYYSPATFTSIIEPTEKNIKIYPNPVVDMLRISNAQGELNVKLYDLQGILLLQTNQNTLDFSAYKAGVYFLNVNGQIKKIVKK